MKALHRAVALGLVGALAAPALAQPAAQPKPKDIQSQDTAAEAPADPHRWFYQSLSVLRLNPLGLITRNQIGYMYKLWGAPPVDESAPLGQKLKQNTYLKVALNTQLSPGFVRPGVLVEAVPLALLVLRARLEHHTYFGAFNLTTDFDSPTAAHDEDTLDAAHSYATTGWSARLDARLQIKLGKVAARSELRAEYFNLDLEDDAPVFYESVLDTLVPNRGWGLVKDTDLLYFANDNWIIGARWTWTKALFEADDYRPGEAQTPNNSPMHRVGPAIIWQMDPKRTGTLFNQPTMFLITQFWLEHASRAGQQVTQAYPYTLLGFAFNGDL
ncbi:MAG: hypothetical protein KC613_19260 [Myxococcales bacterium]|nr:hypothetical protein [Myxococcales bacterium]MCB9523220.1 hypothetical protein [Myxococcales bacterium]